MERNLVSNGIRQTDHERLGDAVRAAGWRVPEWLPAYLSSYDREFMRNEMTGMRTREYYERRLGMLGFTKGERVIDAACGIGQWSVAMAKSFEEVVGVDINTSRLLTARVLALEEGCTNCQFMFAPLENLPLENESCDAVFCYGAFMFTDMPQTLREFHRVLRRGGKIYLNANSSGWYAHLLLDRGLRARKLGMVRAALQMIGRTLRRRTSQIVVREKWLVSAVQKAGLRVRAIGPEGTLQLSSEPTVPPAYPPQFYGMTSILELVAEK
jgi:ubiquinone/menaquinone biosynthesis C-methylase UbiE